MPRIAQESSKYLFLFWSSDNRACFGPRVNSFSIKSFFYTGIKQWNALPSATQLISNKQAIKSEAKKLLWMKPIQLDEEIYLFY